MTTANPELLMQGAASVDVLCGRHGGRVPEEEFMRAVNYIRGPPTELKTKVALHMLQQCAAHKAGQPTRPYTLPKDVSPEDVRMLGEEGWLVMKPAVLSWSNQMTVHKPSYC